MINRQINVDELFQWKDQYCIGVEEVDAAHQKLFSIVRRLLKNLITGDYEKNKITCIEAVKYLKRYAIEHFAQEEAYQLKIGYGGYETHRQIHTDMREITIPALEKDMIDADFSSESVERFVGVCAAWLTSHIMLEDQAIVGKLPSKWTIDINEDLHTALKNRAEQYMKTMFQVKIVPENLYYDAYDVGTCMYYYLVCKGESKNIYRCAIIMERSLILETLSNMSGSKLTVIDEFSMAMFKELAQDFLANFIFDYAKDKVKVINEGIVDKKAFKSEFNKQHPEISMLWNSKYGHCAFCLKTVKPKT